MSNNITIKQYLENKNIPFQEKGDELITKCLFNNCDNDSKGNEAHLYFNKNTSQYECKKCGEKGNLITLQKHFDDFTPQKKSLYNKTNPEFNTDLVNKCHENLPDRIRKYLNDRGIEDGLINAYKLGYISLFKKKWITIPILNEDGYQFFKLRQDPADGKEKMTYPNGIEAMLYGMYASPEDDLIICEGELDALALISEGKHALTSSHGANTFKKEWIDEDIKNAKSIYVCFDNDKAGRTGSEKVLRLLKESGVKNLYQINLPSEIGEAGDITDYLTKLKYPIEDLFTKYSTPYPINHTQFKEIDSDELSEILGLTIKKDNENKLVTFLCQLSAYTEENAFNILFSSPSSSGKSYIALETAKLFPSDDVMKLGNCSKTAFFHDTGEYNKEENLITIDLSRKILIFTDAPHTQLLEALRSLLSHDEKSMFSKITDKDQKGGHRTKNVELRGFPSVIFCTAGLRLDQQEMTRFILLSPEINQDKIRAGIENVISKEIDPDKYNKTIEDNPNRQNLKLRIEAIKQEYIGEIRILDEEKIKERFLKFGKRLQPRHQRDIKKLFALIKAFTLLNLWFRERQGDVLVADDKDIENALKLWDQISPSQELNISPYLYGIYKDVIVPAYNEKNTDPFNDKVGLSRQEIMDKHYQVYQRFLDQNTLRQQILPMLETAGLIYQEKDKEDYRKILVHLSTSYTSENNSEMNCGVEVSGIKISDNEDGEIEIIKDKI